mmetsp:Transcript_4368/g.10687  ORF Transcript_4368/g.10687 Transcript_4368/m.10687 type:complete len:215 (-) Transcript_4368:34-678(-)|eukprot:3820906-Amphidinium_carterae.2
MLALRVVLQAVFMALLRDGIVAVQAADLAIPSTAPNALETYRLIGYGFIRDFMLEDYEYLARMKKTTREACALACGLRKRCKAFTWRIAAKECDLERVNYTVASLQDAWVDDHSDKDFVFYDKLAKKPSSTTRTGAPRKTGPRTNKRAYQIPASNERTSVTSAETLTTSVAGSKTVSTTKASSMTTTARSGAMMDRFSLAVVWSLAALLGLQCA